ncbi:MAG: TonB-dependent receptor [Bryobacterales bacterium]|nr:TonB-dependent receptor [Bryobacterales bacterium]
MPRLLVAVLFAVSSLFAQFTTGRVEGTVSDPASAPISGATLTLTALDTGQTRTATSGSSGAYLFAALPPGRYRLQATAAQFAASSVEISVTTSQTLTHNLTLTIGEQSTSVEVTGEAPVLNTFDPLRAVTRSRTEIQSLPNLNRNIVNMITLAPGVTPTFHPRGGSLTTLNIAQAGQINANGGRSKASAHQLDSTDANDWEFGGIALSTQPTPDMLQEFKVLTNNWAAEYGVKSNAQVLMITRSGTNGLHGSAYNFLQNAALNARDYFDRTGKATPLRQNFFGLTAGGPVIRNRTFVFGGWESRRARGSSPVTLLAVPTESARASVTDPNIRQLLPLLPLPTQETANPRIGTLAASAPSPSNSDQFLLRGDQYLGQHTLTLRYFQNAGSSFNRTAGSLPQYDATFDPVGRNAMAADTWVVNDTTTNELRLSYGRASALFSPASEPVTPRFLVTGLAGFGTVQFWPQGRVFNVYQVHDVVSHIRGRHILKAGVDLRHIQDNSINDSSRRGIYNFASVDAFLAGNVASYSQAFGNTYRGFRMNYHGAFVQDDLKLTRTLTLNLGLRWEHQGGLSEVNQLQSVLDPRVGTAIGAAGTGVLGGFRNQKPVIEANPALFAPRFGFAWNPGAGRVVVRGGYGIFWDSQLFNGLQAGRTTPPSNYSGALAAAQISGANSFANLLAGSSQYQRDLNGQIGSFGTLRNLGGITSQLPDFRNPYAQHFSLGVQTRLSTSLVTDISYVGTKGTALATFGPGNAVQPGLRPAPAVSLDDERARLSEFLSAAARANGNATTPAPRLDPRFNTVNLIRDNGSSIYHSLQMELRKSLTRGLQVQAGYTWSRSVDNGSDYSPGQATTDRSFAQDQFNYRGERGPSAYDIPHRFVLSHVWQLPLGVTFASINQWQSGIPFTVMSGPRLGIADVNMDGDISGAFDNARASCLASGSGFRFGDDGSIPAPALRGVNGAPNASGFRYVQPLLGNHGTCGRNTERMNRVVNFDWTFSKRFQLREAGPLDSGPFALEARADFFNIFNIPFLTAAGDDFRNLASPLFGLANAAAPSRRLQLALRLTW